MPKIDQRVEALAERLSTAIFSRSRGYLCEWDSSLNEDASRLREFLTLDLFASRVGAWVALSDDLGDAFFDATSRKVGLRFAEVMGENEQQFHQHVAQRHAEYKSAARGHEELEDQIGSIAEHFSKCIDDPTVAGWIRGIFQLLLFSTHRSVATLDSGDGC